MSDWLFDGQNRIMYEPSGSGDTTFDIERDIYSAWKRWMVTSDGSKYPSAFLVEGGTPTGDTGLFTGKTLVLTNGWKIRAADHAHQVRLEGNLFSDDGILSVATESFNTTIFVNSSVSAQGIATGSGVTPQDIIDIARRVWDEEL